MKRYPLAGWAVLISFTLASCNYRGALPTDFYKPGPEVQPKVPMNVALVVTPAMKDMTTTGNGFGQPTYELHPAIAQTLEKELGTIFQNVKETENPAAVKDADALAFVQPVLFGAYELTLKAPGSDVILGHYWDPQTYPEGYGNECNGWAFLTGFTLLLGSPITIPAGIACTRNAVSSKAENAIQGHFRAIGDLIRKDTKLAAVRKEKAGVQSEEKQGDDASAAGDRYKAIEHYSAAVKNSAYDSAADQRLKEKILTLVAALPAAPAVPEEARRDTVHGQTLYKAAATSGDYQPAAAEFEKAVREAPFWPDTYYNLGLLYADAKRYPEAIRNLKFYLKGAPTSPDARAVQNKIYELEVMPGATPAQ